MKLTKYTFINRLILGAGVMLGIYNPVCYEQKIDCKVRPYASYSDMDKHDYYGHHIIDMSIDGVPKASGKINLSDFIEKTQDKYGEYTYIDFQRAAEQVFLSNALDIMNNFGIHFCFNKNDVKDVKLGKRTTLDHLYRIDAFKCMRLEISRLVDLIPKALWTEDSKKAFHNFRVDLEVFIQQLEADALAFKEKEQN